MRRLVGGASAAALCLALTACGGSDGGSSGPVVTPSPSPSPAPSPSPSPSPTPTPTPTPAPVQEPTGNIVPVHDPAIIAADGDYYIYSTSQVGEAPGLIPIRRSHDLVDWELIGAVYQAIPQWAQTRVPGTSGIWAPAIWHEGDEYRLYYTVSTFGSNVSAIGLTTSPTLDPDDPAYKWTDKGIVIGSDAGDDYNAIDPSIAESADGRQWMVFGSFWSGIKLVELDPATGKPKEADPTLIALAQRPSPDAIEAPVIVPHDGYYYLFASYDFCCRGSSSTYYTVVGRSADITGPYLDKQGQPMLEGHAEVVLDADTDPNGRYVGPGSVGVLTEGGRTVIAYHAYDTQRNGAPTLRIRPIIWGSDGWPEVQ